jgi:hypothetical protein
MCCRSIVVEFCHTDIELMQSIVPLLMSLTLVVLYLAGDQSNRQSVAVSPRAGLLVEMYAAEESVFNQSLAAYRLGDYKLIKGTVRDDNYYLESTNNKINCSHVSIGSQVIETVIDLFDTVFGKGQSDTVNIIMVHMWLHDLIVFTDALFPRSTQYLQTTAAADTAAHEATDLRLYNIAADPCEKVNLARDPQYASIIAAIEAELASITANRPPSLPIDLQIDISLGGQWSKHHVGGDCSSNPTIKPAHCRFTHSWVADVSRSVDFFHSFLEPGLPCVALYSFSHLSLTPALWLSVRVMRYACFCVVTVPYFPIVCTVSLCIVSHW